MLPLGILNAWTRKARTTTNSPTAMMNDFAHSHSHRAPVRLTRRSASARLCWEMRVGTAAPGSGAAGAGALGADAAGDGGAASGSLMRAPPTTGNGDHRTR